MKNLFKKIKKVAVTGASYVAGAGMAAAWFVNMIFKGKKRW